MQYIVNFKYLIAVLVFLIGIISIYQFFGGPINSAISNINNYPVLIIDAGHGGMDGGAVGISGSLESDINLKIAKKLNYISNFIGLETVMIREEDVSLGYNPSKSIRENKNTDLKMRKQIADGIDNGIFLSIHQNRFTESIYKGAQVFYSGNSPKGEVLAKYIQNSMVNGLDKSNNRKEKKGDNSIYLLKQLNIPAVIVETGFISNAYEETLLNTDDYQRKVSICILSGVEKFINGES